MGTGKSTRCNLIARVQLVVWCLARGMLIRSLPGLSESLDRSSGGTFFGVGFFVGAEGLTGLELGVC